MISQIAHHWCAADHQVEIVTFDRPGDRVFHALPAGVLLHRLGVDGAIGRVIALRRLFARRRPDRVVSFLTKINLICALACLGTKARLVCSERNNPERQGAHPLWNAALRLAYHRAGVIVCQTDAVRRCFAPSLQGRLVTIPNPVPASAPIERTGSASRICAVGRLTHQKGFDVLLDAFAVLAPRHPRWTLDIWGEGPGRAALEKQISALGLEGRARLRGLSLQPRSWAREADIFVLSSRYEGFPNVLGEAMAAGLPVAAANCDFGPSDMVENGRTGLLVPGEDSAALAGAIETLIVDPELRARLGSAGRKAMERFGSERVLRQWDAVLARAGERSSRAATAPIPAIFGGR